MTRNVILEATNIRKWFGSVEVLHGVSLELRSGEVLALLGENGAGKSTLVRVLAGDHVPDSGHVVVDGVEIGHDLSPRTMRAKGLHLIPQEPTGIDSLTVAENVVLGAWPRRMGLVDWRAMRKRATTVLAELGLQIDVDRLVGTLGIGQRRLVDIARAFVADARVLVLDEPTAALSQAETDELFRLVRRLRDKGAGIIYITHRLPEVDALADRVQVLRDGTVVLVADKADVSKDDIVTAMVGSTVVESRHISQYSLEASPGSAAVELSRASSWPSFADVSLEARVGEVLVLFGKVGSGATEVADCLFGLREIDEGTLRVDGKEVRFNSPAHAIRCGIGYLPGDRRSSGFPDLSLAANLCAPSWPGLSSASLITARCESAVYSKWRTLLTVRGGGEGDATLSSMSGGNQQKILLGRWLQMQSKVLVLVEPTQGVDIKARQDIYRLVERAASEGSSVIVATSDHEEAALIADRAVIMSAGFVVACLDREEINEERLLETAIFGERMTLRQDALISSDTDGSSW